MGTDGNEGVAKLRVLIFGNYLVLNFLLVCLLPCLQPTASLQ